MLVNLDGKQTEIFTAAQSPSRRRQAAADQLDIKKDILKNGRYAAVHTAAWTQHP